MVVWQRIRVRRLYTRVMNGLVLKVNSFVGAFSCEKYL